MTDSNQPRPELKSVADKPQVYHPAPDVDEEELDLGELIGVLIENRWLILAIALGAVAAGSFNAWTATPIYRADATVQVEAKQTGLDVLDFTGNFENDPSIGAEIEILQSRSLLGDVVDDLKLELKAEPEYFPYVGAALARRKPDSEQPKIKVDSLDVADSVGGQVLTVVARGASNYDGLDDSGGLIFRGKVGETASGDSIALFVSKLQGDNGQRFQVWRQSRIGAIYDLQGRMTVAERGEWTGVLSITVEGTDPESIKEQVDGIANAYVSQNVERKSAEAESSLAFLDEQLPIIRQEMQAAEVALNDFRLEKGSVDLPLETQAILQTIVKVEAQLSGLRQQRDKLTQAFTEIHPTIIALDRQIDSLNEQLNNLNGQVFELPTTQQEVLRLVRDVEVNTALYTALLNTAQELRVTKAGTVGNVRVIDYAVEPTWPVNPSQSRIMLISLLLGSFAGVAIAFAKKALKAGVEDADLIEKHINIPVYASVSHSSRQDRLYKDMRSNETERAILAVDAPNDPAIESLRNLKTALHFGMMNVKNNCVMIAGPSPNVGKSFVSVNLAAVLTSNNKKVLLIDADLRRGHLHEYLGIEIQNGLTEFISGQISIGQALHQTTVPGLTLIPTGTIPPNPVELLLHERFGNCLNVLMPRYDHVIIDSPPILAVTDATIIGQMAGGTLLVLRAGQHPMREIDHAARRLNRARVNLRGILFNNVSVRSQRYGAGRNSYEHTYKYS